jgi:hypothetical protein
MSSGWFHADFKNTGLVVRIEIAKTKEVAGSLHSKGQTASDVSEKGTASIFRVEL